jgi:hypothetical protein
MQTMGVQVHLHAHALHIVKRPPRLALLGLVDRLAEM